MTHKERIETAWRFQEPDRVPFEIGFPPAWRDMPEAARLVRLVDEHADNFGSAPGASWGLLGMQGDCTETVIEQRPGEYERRKRTWQTEAGEFHAITYHPAGTSDYHWEKRYVACIDDLKRIAGVKRNPAPWDYHAFKKACNGMGRERVLLTGLFHPLGTLVRNAAMEEMYAWFRAEPKLIHQYLRRACDQVVATVEQMQSRHGSGICFTSAAHEMLIPPWMGHELFDEFVFPYDSRVYSAVHAGGGRFRAHCHGNCMDFLEKFAEMGVDSIEPLEPQPMGDVILAEAKQKVGHRILLSGNIRSEMFISYSEDDVRNSVREAIAAAAPGGGFTLRLTGCYPGSGVDMSGEILEKTIRNGEVYVESAMDYGQYPL